MNEPETTRPRAHALSAPFWTDEKIEALKELSRSDLNPAPRDGRPGRRLNTLPTSSERRVRPGFSEITPIEYDSEPRPRFDARVKTGQPLAIHLTIHTLDRLVHDLLPFYGVACPVAVVLSVEKPGDEVVRGTLETIEYLTSSASDTTSLFVLIG